MSAFVAAVEQVFDRWHGVPHRSGRWDLKDAFAVLVPHLAHQKGHVDAMPGLREAMQVMTDAEWQILYEGYGHQASTLRSVERAVRNRR